jgi:hypothetical protein
MTDPIFQCNTQVPDNEENRKCRAVQVYGPTIPKQIQLFKRVSAKFRNQKPKLLPTEEESRLFHKVEFIALVRLAIELPTTLALD